MTELEMFIKLPSLDDSFKVASEDAYNPTLYYYDSEYVVDWIHCEDSDSLVSVTGNTIEEAIKKAYELCDLNNLIK